MYRGFELDIHGWDIETYRKDGVEVFDIFEPMVTTVLDAYLKENKDLDGAKMQEDWFPEVKADIFISHSHTDKDFAICLAGWLKVNFGITSFIDSMIWGYADKLLKKIDIKYCKNENDDNYNYKLRNHSTSHVHIMLATALTKMIDKTECFFFIKTPNSITTKKAIKQAGTYSPWIYSEVEMSRLIRKQPLKMYRKVSAAEIRTFSDKNQVFLNESFRVEHHLNLEHLASLSPDELNLWNWQFGLENCRFPLDQLYMNHPLNIML